MLYKNPFHGFSHTWHILMGIPIYAPLRSALNGCPPDIQHPCDSRAGYKHHLTDGYLRHLQQMAKTIPYVQEHHYDTRESLQMSFEEISEKWKESRKAVKSTEAKIKKINEQIHYAGQYLANKPVFAQMLKARNKKKFRQEHQAELELYESAVKFFKEKNADGKIPSMRFNAAPDGIFPLK